MNYLELIGWIGNFGFFGGAILLARLKRIGWVFHMLGNVMYFIQGIMLGLYSLTILSFVLFIVDAYGFKKWGKKNV